MSLQDALADLKLELIQTQKDAAELLAESAEVYGLNPDLIARKFQEMHGVPVSGYRQLAEQAADAASRTAAAKEEEARAEARLFFRTRLSANARAEALVGLPFEMSGEAFVFISFIRGRPRWNAYGVRVRDGAVRKLSIPRPDLFLDKLRSGARN